MRLLVPIDGSDLSMHAIQHVARVVHRGEIVLFHVTGIPPRLLEHRGAETNAQERQLERQVAEQSREYEEEEIRPRVERELFRPAESRLLRDKDRGAVRVTSKIVTEASPQPAMAIITEAEAGEYDAVVVGRHGHSGVERFVLGGTASKVVHHLQKTPIWLVP